MPRRKRRRPRPRQRKHRRRPSSSNINSSSSRTVTAITASLTKGASRFWKSCSTDRSIGSGRERKKQPDRLALAFGREPAGEEVEDDHDRSGQEQGRDQ